MKQQKISKKITVSTAFVVCLALGANVCAMKKGEEEPWQGRTSNFPRSLASSSVRGLPELDFSSLEAFCLERYGEIPTEVTELNLSEKFKITEESIKVIAEHCPKLEKLDLTSGEVVSLVGLERLDNLEELSLRGCRDIPWQDFEHLPTSLRILNLSFSNITNDVLMHVATRCPELKDLDLSGTEVTSLRSLLNLSNLNEVIISQCLSLREGDYEGLVEKGVTISGGNSFSPTQEL